MRKDNGPHPGRASPASSRRDQRRRKGDLEMYTERFYLMEDRDLREQYLAERMAERKRYARSKRNLRARVARRLFSLAVAAEREETWCIVWERLEAKGRL